MNSPIYCESARQYGFLVCVMYYAYRWVSGLRKAVGSWVRDKGFRESSSKGWVFLTKQISASIMELIKIIRKEHFSLVILSVSSSKLWNHGVIGDTFEGKGLVLKLYQKLLMQT